MLFIILCFLLILNIKSIYLPESFEAALKKNQRPEIFLKSYCRCGLFGKYQKSLLLLYICLFFPLLLKWIKKKKLNNHGKKNRQI
ncbi:hypothetical protein BCR32DRAFT_41883 [Anaeromyces robustus]|uniref:Uncharacterized protein n=1 Tax=Anaeromyces robustus TaxID=1754192 RepID=A0A1Y1WZK7_9FUNG|nr:hypothetical protein BCR32DRAFT_41883 [Anaeromyces robustus]|eukprot:ORX78872.1 hypothetical protein BCR32DRAFT_41883 [Anaeromyces robustus]